MKLLDLSQLGPRQRQDNHIVDFGLYLPWITTTAGYSVSVKLIHENDQFIKSVPAISFPLKQEKVDAVYGTYWSGVVDISSTPSPSGARGWGNSGRYLYRFEVAHAQHGRLVDWVIDPFAREYGVGKMSAFTLDYMPHDWSAAEESWRVPDLRDLVVYEIHLGEFANGIKGAINRLDYLADLGVNCLEILPISNVVESIRWGFQPIGFFGVDDRYGNRKDFQHLIDEAHRRGIAVILDVVFGHTGSNFPYSYLYRELGFADNPFHAACFGDDFGFGERTDFCNPYVNDFFYTVSHHWLDCYHVDGFRYDCVPEYWDSVGMRGFHDLVYNTYQETKEKIGSGEWLRFAGGNGEISIIQCAEQLDKPREAIANTYGNCTWQNWTLDTAVAVAIKSGNEQAESIRGLGRMLGLDQFVRHETMNGDSRTKTAFQYIESHDKSRFLNLFGEYRKPGYHLFPVGKRENWYALQPYLIAMLLGDGVPMLWQGQELCENNSLPGQGEGRVGVLRPVHWEYFYDNYGKGTLWLVRQLLNLRKNEAQFRHGQYYFFDNWHDYLLKKVLIYRRRLDGVDSIVAVNFGKEYQSVRFRFERGGNYREELHGAEFQLNNISSDQSYELDVPSHYGRIWTCET